MKYFPRKIFAGQNTLWRPAHNINKIKIIRNIRNINNNNNSSEILGIVQIQSTKGRQFCQSFRNFVLSPNIRASNYPKPDTYIIKYVIVPTSPMSSKLW